MVVKSIYDCWKDFIESKTKSSKVPWKMMPSNLYIQVKSKDKNEKNRLQIKKINIK